MKKSRKANSVDLHVACRLKDRREVLGLSQADLGAALGVTFQQIQKIEYGVNRVSAGNLWKAAKLLGKPVGYFYEGVQ